VKDIAIKLNSHYNTISKYVVGIKPDKIEKPVKKIKMKPLKKIKKEIVPREIARDYLGKGFEKGAMPVEVVLRADRDDGILLGIVYRDLGNVDKNIRIRIKETDDKELKAKNWCKKFGKKYVNYF